jgi:hypothetical protein
VSAADEIAADARRLAEFPGEVARRAVDTLAAAVRPRVLVDTGGDEQLSGMRSGGRLRVITSVSDGFAVAEGSVAAGPRKLLGPWRWRNDGTRPHGNHPGTRPARTWDEPIEQAMPVLVEQIDDLFRVVIR